MSEERVIELSQLSKSFGTFQAVHHLDLEIFKGDVFGFLGPNGAGKSTTIRMLLSLVKPTAGEIFLFGKKLSKNRNEILRRIGCIIEKPDFYLYLSAEKNIEIFAKLSGIHPGKNKIHEVLEQVGLKGREKDKVKKYSHGMKQRLGIAQTLIHDPELIILDEPTTGLDPQGIIDVRNLIRHLHADRGKTIFLSSHILSEIEMIATRMAILNKGTAMVQGRVDELLSTHEVIVSVEVENPEKAREMIRESQWQRHLKESANHHLDFEIPKSEIPALTKKLMESGIQIFGVNYRKTLEDYFLKLTHDHGKP